MTLSAKSIIVSGILSSALLLPVTSLAQDQAPAGDLLTTAARNVASSSLFRAAAATRAGELASPPRRSHGDGVGPVAKGALIGAAASLIATALAARSYGENESGGFCGLCMLEWSSFTVPVGAGIGAAIGYGIGRARHSVIAAPMFSRKAAAVIVTARF
jgi:hypothetical protein